jgi:hypothetical protein
MEGLALLDCRFWGIKQQFYTLVIVSGSERMSGIA